MKVWIKILIAGIVGFGGGFASGFFVHKKLNDVKFEEISPEEMSEIEERIAREQKQKQDDKKEFDPTTIEDIPENTDDLRNAIQGKTPYIQADLDTKKAYEKVWNITKDYSNEQNANHIPTEEIDDADDEYPSEEDYDEEVLEAIEMEAEEAGNNFVEPPHLISLGDFYNDRPEFDKITIEWFEPDNVWIDEKEEFIPDIKSYIGMEVKNLFASNTPDDDPDVRFVRNEQYGSDYEIIRHHRSWRETAGGG